MAVLMEKSLREEFTIADAQEKFSYLAHSDINGQDSEKVLEHLKTAGDRLKSAIENATHVILTLGTAWIYELAETGQIVANCHQQPQRLFNKRMLESKEILASLDNMESLIKSVNSTAQVIYTLSPVRHIKDGMVENSRSKARLHDAIQQRCDTSDVYYFPSYEILMDELRDYRFYERDMIHPNATAVDYVWSRFRESVLNQNTSTALKAIEKHRKLAQHRPKNPELHQLQLADSQENIIANFPYIQL